MFTSAPTLPGLDDKEGRNSLTDTAPQHLPHLSASLVDGKTTQPCPSQQGGDGQDTAVSRYPQEAAGPFPSFRLLDGRWGSRG